jgi:hypothetical protein
MPDSENDTPAVSISSATWSPPNYSNLLPDLFAVDVADLSFDQESRIVENSRSCIYRYKDHYAASVRRSNALKEINTMRSLPEISIPVLGYILDVSGWDIRYIMPLATPVPTDGSLAQKKEFMAQMIALPALR